MSILRYIDQWLRDDHCDTRRKILETLTADRWTEICRLAAKDRAWVAARKRRQMWGYEAVLRLLCDHEDQLHASTAQQALAIDVPTPTRTDARW